MLTSIKLGQYGDAFVDQAGYDDLPYLLALGQLDGGRLRIEAAANAAAMKRGHKEKLISYLTAPWALTSSLPSASGH